MMGVTTDVGEVLAPVGLKVLGRGGKESTGVCASLALETGLAAWLLLLVGPEMGAALIVLIIVIVELHEPVPKTKNSPRIDVTVVTQSAFVERVKNDVDGGICAIGSSTLVLDVVKLNDS